MDTPKTATHRSTSSGIYYRKAKRSKEWQYWSRVESGWKTSARGVYLEKNNELLTIDEYDKKMNAESEDWPEDRIDTIGSNGNDGLHYQAPPNPPPSKYHRMINGKWADVYDVLTAFEVTNPADTHAIKKMLLPGLRGVKDGIQDRREAIQSLERAIQIEQELHDSHL